jgi:hypothetical protein
MERPTGARLREVEKARRVLLARFEAEQARRAPDYWRNLTIYESLHEEALALGALPLQDPLEGIEVDLALAQALRVQAAS